MQFRLGGYLLPCLLAVIVIAVLWPILYGQFVGDDELLLVRSTHVHTGSLWDTVSSPLFQDTNKYWRPLTSATLWLGFHLGGGQPAPMHWMSIAVHVGVMLLVFRIAREWLDSRAAAAVAALFFALHPVQIQPVAWIAAINDGMWSGFALLSLLAWQRWRRAGSRGLPFLAFAAGVLAVLSKEAGAIVPALWVVHDLATRPRHWRASVFRVGVATSILAGLYAMARTAVLHDGLASIEPDLTLSRILTLPGEAVGQCLTLLALPLRRDIEWRVLSSPDSVATLVVQHAITLATLGAFVWAVWRKRTVLVLGLGLTLVPIWLIGIMSPSLGAWSVADRYLYLPAFGTGLLLALAARRFGRPALVACAPLFLLFAMIDRDLIPGWSNPRDHAEWLVSLRPDDPLARFSLARAALLDHLASGDARDLDTAREMFTRLDEAASRRDALMHAWYEHKLGSIRSSRLWCDHLVSKRDGIPLDFGVTVASFARLAESRPNDPHARQNYGVALAMSGRQREARAEFEASAGLDPFCSEVWFNLARARMFDGDLLGASQAIDRALAIRPGDQNASALRRQIERAILVRR